MSTGGGGDLPFAFGEGAAEQFKERLKQLMRAQQEACEEVQAEQPAAVAAAGAQLSPVQQAIDLAAAGLRALTPQPTARDAADAMVLLFERASEAVARAGAQDRP